MAESVPIANLIELSGGSFLMGNEQDAYPADGEGLTRFEAIVNAVGVVQVDLNRIYSP